VNTVDVAIIGLGVIGSACAAELSARGYEVVGIEQSRADRLEGSSAGGSKLLKAFHPGRADLSTLVKRSRAEWLDRGARTGHTLFVPTGGLVIGARSDQVWMRYLGEHERSIPGTRVLGPVEVAARAPWAWCPPDCLAISEPEAGVLLSGPCVNALRDLAMASGAKLRFGAHAELFETSDAGADRPILVKFNEEVVVAERVLYCVGPWALGLRFGEQVPGLRLERVAMHWTRSRSAETISCEASPFATWWLADEQFCVLPWLEGQGLKFGRFGTDSAMLTGSSRVGVSAAELEADVGLLARLVPSLAEVGFFKSAHCRYTHVKDGEFALTRIGPRVHILSACSGRGFKFAPLIAEAVANHPGFTNGASRGFEAHFKLRL
jgi:sarcosine oxidase